MSFLPNKIILGEYIHQVIKEDITYNDITTDLIIDDNQTVEAIINFRQTGLVCGLPFAKEVFNILDSSVEWVLFKNEGEKVSANTDIARLIGNAKSVLTAERTVLNLLQKASGIATITSQYMEKLLSSKTKLTDTRKTTPGARLLEKYAIRIGGAIPHRYNLSDCVLIKDNHIAMAGSITNAVNKIRKNISHTIKIEVETETKNQVLEALENKVDIIMLDNMTVEQMTEMVKLINGSAIVEASGNVNIDMLEEIAKSGVDYISTSAITIKAQVLDIGLDIKQLP